MKQKSRTLKSNYYQNKLYQTHEKKMQRKKNSILTQNSQKKGNAIT